VETVVPVEIYNPGDEPVHLYKKTNLGVLSPLLQVTDKKISDTDAVPKFVSHVVQARKQDELPVELIKLVDEASDVLDPPDLSTC